MRLGELQNLLYRLIVAPEGVAQGLAAERELAPGALAAIIAGDDRLSAEARLSIYADMYFYRLLAVLEEDYPATLKVLGDDGFHNLATAYLIVHPPTEPSISYAGEQLADYLRAHPIERLPFLADLAALERALVDSFVGADAPPLDSSAMRAVEPPAWPRLRLRTHPATRIVGCDWEVAALLRALEAGHDWEPPAHRPAHVLVWRKDAAVFYRELERAEAAALERARRGASFAAMCDAAQRELRGTGGVAEINRMLERWLLDGVLVRARPTSRSRLK